MFIILYRWRIKPELEKQFIEAWSEVSAFYRENAGSLGSRLHRGSDGLFYSYAQWPSTLERERAFAALPDLKARQKMREAVAESLPEVVLENVSDFLILPEGE